MAKTATGLLSRDLEFEIIGDYTHPSPLLQKKGRNLFNPPLWCSFGGRPGTVGIVAGLKKGQNIRNREGLWPQLTGKRASWPVNKRCWV